MLEVRMHVDRHSDSQQHHCMGAIKVRGVSMVVIVVFYLFLFF